MGQQEFLSRKSEPQQESFRYQAPKKNRDELKEEHPATFEDSIPPYSYRAQDSVTYTQENRAESSSSLKQPLQGGVPVWARPQPRRSKPILRWAIVIVLALVMIKLVIPLIVGIIIALIAAAAFIILVPLLIILALLIAGTVLVALAVLGISGGLRLHHRR